MDLLYFLAIIIPIAAQIYVSYTYNRFKKVRNDFGLTGFDVAKKILEVNGLEKLYVVETQGKLTDHYDSSRKTIRLSSEVYHEESIAALAIAAHECGHALQDKEGYFFLRLRAMIYPVVSIGTKFAYVLLIIGFLFELMNMIIVAIALYGLGLVFQLITLPVEFDASKRALNMLRSLHICNQVGDDGTGKMLRAAAFTYVAGVLSSALEIIRLLAIFNRERD
ncbi:MAG: zinc metallopeptidase [Tenericutes bacterium]|nr:zinc metallopeptidase [Mycoplasmatota bacterium]